MPQEIIVDGMVFFDDNKKLKRVKDKGYSFCNCNNIFFTDWKNIKQNVYDEEYFKKYVNISKHVHTKLADIVLPKILKSNKKAKTMLEVGSISDIILNKAKELGLEPVGNDIFSHDSKHTSIVGNFEEINFIDKYDVIFASHVFEHFKKPVEAMKKCYDLLNEGGVLFVAMPDTWFIVWQNPYSWAHWIVQEHYILWDMDSFIDKLIDVGFELVENKRTIGLEIDTFSGDMQIIMRKPCQT